MADIDGKTITLGGKGFSLSSAIIHTISAGLAAVRIDSSAQDNIDKIAATKDSFSGSSYTFASLYEFSREERRAAFTVLLQKFLKSACFGVCRVIPGIAYKGLSSNESPETFRDRLYQLTVTNEELCILDRSHFYLYGVSALLDYELTSLSMVVDAVAALSCEAIKADISVFNLMDSGDGFIMKEEIGVANDMKVLLNGSKLVGGGQVNCKEVSSIPKIHASLRNAVKLVHAETRINVNSSIKADPGCSDDGGARAAVGWLLPMAGALLSVGESSYNRVERNLDSITCDSLRSTLVPMFESKCLQDLDSKFKPIMDAYLSKNYNCFAHELYGFSKSIWEIVAWELVSAFALVEGAELSGNGQDQGEGDADAQGENKSQKKKKKKKVALGKGTNAIVQLVKDMVQNNNEENTEKSVNDILLSFNTKNPEFNNVLKILKEIVESNDTRRLPKIPKGTRDFAKEQMAIRKKTFSIITEVFEKHGATALDTPVFELRETLMGKYGEDSKLVYDLADQGGELCSLRYDLTVPFARYMAMNGLTSLKRYQIAKVYRRDNPSKGRYREFYQCDFDIAGQYTRMGPDSEVVYVLIELLDKLNIGEYEVKLNHRKLLDGMLEICGVPPEKFRTICSSIDKLDKQNLEQIKKEMVEEKGLTEEIADAIGDFVKEKDRPLELLNKLKAEGSKFLQNEGCVNALNDLEILFNSLEAAQCIDKIVFDLSLARGLDYYTGVIFEAVFNGTTQVGSIAAGGRYDNLIGMFGTKQVPAVGVSLGIERVFAIMEAQTDQNQVIRATETQVLVAFLGDDLTEAFKLVTPFWRAGVKAEYLVNKNVMKHIDYAKQSKIPYMVVVGGNELKEGVVKLKDIKAFTEETISRDEIVQKLKIKLENRFESITRPDRKTHQKD